MTPHEHIYEHELQKEIEEQEQAMSQMLLRVMERPLTPLHNTLEAMAAQIVAVQKASVQATQSVELNLSDALEEQNKRVKRQFSDLTDNVDKLKEVLAEFAQTLDTKYTDHGKRDQHLQDSLTRVNDMLAQQQTNGNDRFSKTTALFDQIDTQLATTSDNLIAATRAIEKLDTDVTTLGEQEVVIASRIGNSLKNLSKQLDLQQTAMNDRIDAVQPALVPHFNDLAATIDKSAQEIAGRHHALSASQRELVTATVQEQLAIQLMPLRAKNTLLLSVCALSFTLTVALLVLHFYP